MSPVWLDADPGFDDWMTMLMLAQAHREQTIQWVGTGIVHGNAPLDITWRNAQAIKESYALPCSIYKGSSAVLSGPQITAQNVLGSNGMRTMGVPLEIEASAQETTDHAVDALLHAIEKHAFELTILTIGPLTNIALALQKEPSIKAKIKALVMMGGSTDRGNHTPAAEFNIYADAQAASEVFSAGLPIVMVGLNVCRQVSISQHHVQAFYAKPGSKAQCFAGYLDGYQRIRSADGSVPMPLYDPVAAAYLLHPALFELSDARVDVELAGSFTRGMTVCNFKLPPNAKLAMQCNAVDVREHIFAGVQAYLSTL